MPYFLSLEKRIEFDESLEKLKIVRELPLNTKIVYVTMKREWPVGPRDCLIGQQLVRLEDKAWIVNHSIEDEEMPEVTGITRINNLN